MGSTLLTLLALPFLVIGFLILVFSIFALIFSANMFLQMLIFGFVFIGIGTWLRKKAHLKNIEDEETVRARARRKVKAEKY